MFSKPRFTLDIVAALQKQVCLLQPRKNILVFSPDEFFEDILPVALLFIGSVAYTQIVNIESRRINTDTTGWAGSLGGGFNLSENVDRVFSASSFAHVQYKTKKRPVFVIG